MRLLVVLVGPLVACTATDPSANSPGHWTPGKGDGAYDLVEAGPAPIGGSVSFTLDQSVPAYRVESFGGTQLTIDLTSGDADPYLVVEGPLDNNGDTVAVGGGPVVAEGAAPITLTLATGVYRILAGTSDSLGQGEAATGDLALAVTCNATCWRSQIDQPTFVRALQQFLDFLLVFFL